MVKIWRVYEGSPSTIGEPHGEWPLADAIRLLQLRSEHFLADLSRPPKFGDSTQNLTMLGFRYVVVEIGADEETAEWKSGFYLSPVRPSQIRYPLLARRIEERIGGEWHVQLEEARDADGERAVWAWISLKENAPATAWARENRERIETLVREAAIASGISDWVFVRFRKEAEERAAS